MGWKGVKDDRKHLPPRPVPGVENIGGRPSKRFWPVFAGTSTEGEQIVLYNEQGSETKLHIQLPNGELWALGPDGTVEMEFDLMSAMIHVKIRSPQWSGIAHGAYRDLVEAEAR